MSEQQVDRVYRVTDEAIYGFFKEHRFLSNFHLQSVIWNGLVFPSNEGAYQAAKCMDGTEQQRFFNVTPSEAKREGRLVELRPDWEVVKDDVMFVINWQKYCNNPGLREQLLRTGDKHLEETNWWGDIYWGVCNGEGHNQLGKILMRIRDLLK